MERAQGRKGRAGGGRAERKRGGRERASIVLGIVCCGWNIRHQTGNDERGGQIKSNIWSERNILSFK